MVFLCFPMFYRTHWGTNIARQGAEIAPHAELWRAVRPRDGRLSERQTGGEEMGDSPEIVDGS